MVVDRNGQRVPYGVVGELMVADAIHALGPTPPVRTGYLARYSPVRGFEIVDLLDRQVRLHGYRLRLSDLENALYRNPEISVAEATILRSGGAPVLVAYIAGKNGQPASVERASTLLKQTAPEHISSAELISVPSIPRHGDGSPNFQTMPKTSTGPRAVASVAAVPPRDELETKLLKIWEEVLGIREIGIRTSFFSLGGYSLMIVRLFAHINKVLGSALPITTIFNAPTIEELAGILRGQASFSRLVPVQPNGTKPPLFMIHSYLIYEAMRRVLGEDRPLYGLREIDRDDDITIEDRAGLYVREIRSVNSPAPYYIGGWCAAGPLAVETARQLIEAGERVSSVVLFDSWHPGYAAKFAEDQRTNPNMGFRAVLRRKYHFHHMELRTLSMSGRLRYISDAVAMKIRSSRQKFYLKHWALAERLFRTLGIPLPQFMHNVSLKTLVAVREFRGKPFAGNITLIRAEESPYLPQADPACGWNQVATHGVDVHFTPGTHESMFLEPHLSALGKLLERCLEGTAGASADMQVAPQMASDANGTGA